MALPLAVLLNSIRRLRGLLRSMFFLPYVTTGVAVYYAWRYVLEPDGAINLLLRSLGLGSLSAPQGFLADPSTALPTLVVIMIWGSVPIAMLLYLSGLQAIDPQVVEAAQVDGAGVGAPPASHHLAAAGADHRGRRRCSACATRCRASRPSCS